MTLLLVAPFSSVGAAADLVVAAAAAGVASSSGSCDLPPAGTGSDDGRSSWDDWAVNALGHVLSVALVPSS